MVNIPICKAMALKSEEIKKTLVKEPNIAFESKHYGMCKCEHYTAKSYIRHHKDGKWKLIVESTHAKHVLICKQLIKFVKAGLEKEAIVKKRKDITDSM